jgi:hypothetical protein
MFMVNVLRKGYRGLLVRELQGCLNTASGVLKLKPDGDFGAKTEAVVKEFQTAMRLKSDGMVGPKTWQAIRGNMHKRVLLPDMLSTADLDKFFDSLPDSISWDLTTGKAPVTKKDNKNFSRIGFAGYSGQGYVIKDFKKFQDCAIQLLPKVVVIGNGESIPLTLKNECVHFVQYFGVKNTKTWRRGPRVCDFRPGELQEGTVIATLRDGEYHSDYSGRSHVGIYLSHDSYEQYLKSKSKTAAVWMMDQYNGNKIMARPKRYFIDANMPGAPTKKWNDSQGIARSRRVNWGRDGEEYYVLMV